jgi:hypothetical protein
MGALCDLGKLAVQKIARLRRRDQATMGKTVGQVAA